MTPLARGELSPNWRQGGEDHCGDKQCNPFFQTPPYDRSGHGRTFLWAASWEISVPLKCIPALSIPCCAEGDCTINEGLLQRLFLFCRNSKAPNLWRKAGSFFGLFFLLNVILLSDASGSSAFPRKAGSNPYASQWETAGSPRWLAAGEGWAACSAKRSLPVSNIKVSFISISAYCNTS